MFTPCQVETPAYYFEMVEPYRDKFGLITQKDSTMDGGDAAHRTGVFYFGMYLNFADNKEELPKIKKRFLADVNKLRIQPGKFVRHPDSTMWYSNPNNFSRDQTTSLVLALGAFGETKEIRANFENLVRQFSFYPNRLKNWTNEEKKLPFDYRDVAGPSDWGMYIRALNKTQYYSYLYVTDLQLLGNAFTRALISHLDDHDTSDDINYTMLLMQADRVMPTFVSKLSKWVYTKFRKVSPFASEAMKNNPVGSAWEYYFSYVKVRPPLHNIYQCSLEAFNGHEGPADNAVLNITWLENLFSR